MTNETKMAAIIVQMMTGEPLEAEICIGPIYSSALVAVGINDESNLTLRFNADGSDPVEFAEEDFDTARLLASSLTAWADEAERRYRAAEEEMRRRRVEMGI